MSIPVQDPALGNAALGAPPPRPADAASEWKAAEAAADPPAPRGAYARAATTIETTAIAEGVPETRPTSDLAARPKSDDAWWDVADIVGDLGNRAIDALPPVAKQAAGILKNTPPDGMVLGAVVNTPLGKVSAFIIQPTAPANPFVPDLGKAPTVFIGIPGQNIVATVNLNNGQVEFGPGATAPIGPDTVAFYNGRVGGRGVNPGSGPHDVSSVSANFGVINKTLSDPIGDAASGLVVDKVAQALSAIALAADAVTIPSGEGIAASVVIAGVSQSLKAALRNNVDWYGGVAWRGVDVEMYRNGETTVNMSGADFRLNRGNGPGGSGRPSSDFLWDNPLR